MDEQQAQATQTILGKLAGNRDKIEKELSWEELGTEEKVERLRGFTKTSLADVINRQSKHMEALERRIQNLENHQHNDKGQAIIEQRLSSGERNYIGENISYPGNQVAMATLRGSTAEGFI